MKKLNLSVQQSQKVQTIVALFKELNAGMPTGQRITLPEWVIAEYGNWAPLAVDQEAQS